MLLHVSLVLGEQVAIDLMAPGSKHVWELPVCVMKNSHAIMYR